VAEAEKEGNAAAGVSFKNAMAVEKIHHGLYTEALASLRAGADLPVRPLFICAVCGNTVYDAPQERCSVCGAPRTRFLEVK